MAGKEESKSSKALIGLYITFCVLFITWLTTKFFKGRRQVHQAFHTIEEQLQRMQDQLDQRKDEENERMIEYPNVINEEKEECKTETKESEQENDKLKSE